MADISVNEVCHAQAPARSGIWAAILRMMACRKQRRVQAQSEQNHLRDTRLTPAQAEAESRRPAWDVPRHWKQ